MRARCAEVRKNPSRARDIRRRLDELGRLQGAYDGAGEAARAKLDVLRSLRAAPLLRAGELLRYHDILLFLRAYPDDRSVLREVERQLRDFPARVEALKSAAPERWEAELSDQGVVGGSVSNVFSHEMTEFLAHRHGEHVDVDWDEYQDSEAANFLGMLSPLVSWCENDAIENDDQFDPRTWLELSRSSGDPSGLSAALTLLRTSGLSRELAGALYESGEIPVRWRLVDGAASRTLARLPWKDFFFQRGPLAGRTSDLRADLRRPAPPLRAIPAAAGRDYVRAVREALAVRCRELHPLTHASPSEVYLYEPGRGVQIVVYGCAPDVRLPLESNFGAMLVRNGLPVGYGVGAMLLDRAEIAINIFPAHRRGESSWIIEQFFRLFVHHFGARVLVVRSYQVGDDNDEALESGAFWFYYKLGFRPAGKAIAKLAERERALLQADRRRRTPLHLLRRLSKGDLFFRLDEAGSSEWSELRVADLGYTVTRFVARKFGGRRAAAESACVEQVAKALGLDRRRRWTENEITGFRRLAPLLACIPGLGRWRPAEKQLLARIIRAKGSRRERTFVLLVQRHARLREALWNLARAEVKLRSGAAAAP